MSNPQFEPFRKSSKSDQGNCVEVADAIDHSAVLVRDSKDVTGPVLGFDATSWTNFVRGAKAGSFTA